MYSSSHIVAIFFDSVVHINYINILSCGTKVWTQGLALAG
jgi:hypothetical protein